MKPDDGAGKNDFSERAECPGIMGKFGVLSPARFTTATVSRSFQDALRLDTKNQRSNQKLKFEDSFGLMHTLLSAV